MKSDVIVIGSELDGLVAALRLAEQGCSVRLMASGAGSLHYAPGGVHLLGFAPEADEQIGADPFAMIDTLHERHPYRVIGQRRIRAALDWFLAGRASQAVGYRTNGGNSPAMTSAGLEIPVYAWSARQARYEDFAGGAVTVVAFDGYQDLPTGLLLASLNRQGIDCKVIKIPPPKQMSHSVGLARAFDEMASPESYFANCVPELADQTTAAIFPAVLGIRRHGQVVEAAQDALGVQCFEVPTLPPCMPGMRLYSEMLDELKQCGVAIHMGAKVSGFEPRGARIEAIVDAGGRNYGADVFITATGGVLMGGLEVQSDGSVREPVFGLGVHQTRPLERGRADQALDALHETGVETDERLSPLADGELHCENLFVTGMTLAHWQPTREASAEGVAIATGWTAAEEARALLGR